MWYYQDSLRHLPYKQQRVKTHFLILKVSRPRGGHIVGQSRWHTSSNELRSAWYFVEAMLALWANHSMAKCGLSYNSGTCLPHTPKPGGLFIYIQQLDSPIFQCLCTSTNLTLARRSTHSPVYFRHASGMPATQEFS